MDLSNQLKKISVELNDNQIKDITKNVSKIHKTYQETRRVFCKDIYGHATKKNSQIG